MEPPEPDGHSSSDLFLDALDAVPPPDTEETHASATGPPPGSAGNRPEEEITSGPSPSPSSLRRRRPSSKSAASRRIPAAADSNDPSCNSSATSAITTPRERRSKILPSLKDEAVPEREDASSSTLTSSDQISTGRDQDHVSSVRSAATSEVRAGEPPAVDAGPPPQGLLFFVADLVIKAILFQINLLISSFTFPFWLLHRSFLFMTDPFGTLRRGRDGVRERFLLVLKFLPERVSPLVCERLGGQGKLVLRLVWGCLWSFYVCFVLLGLLVTAFLAAGLLMGRVVEEPLRVTEALNFDYTKASPDALVPLGSCDCVGSCLDWRPVPLNHKLQLIISLTLPESDYNRRLGVFQVRAEFLSANGKVTSSSSQPCMLQFKSSHIRFIETFLKSSTLLAGYSSESQILRLKMTGFTEGTEPTMCIRVILEPRAEYRPGAGIPEIYAASLKLESELPLFKRIIWNWRRTVFIWISMGIFIWELLIVLVCCRPVVVVPRARASAGPPSRV